MKKSLSLLMLAMFTIGFMQAQDKQVAGSQNLEFLVAPLSGNPVSIAGIKYRSFSTESSAIRVTVFLGYDTSTDVSLGGEDGETEFNSTSSSFDISVRPGIEKHFTGTDKLSPYYGGELLVGFSSSSDKEEEYDFFEEETYETTVKDGMVTFGANAIAGFDYYFAQNVYIGAEMGFGLAFSSMSDTKFESTQDGADDFESPNGSSFTVGPNAVGQFRVGFLF
jgi:hypothetical protein